MATVPGTKTAAVGDKITAADYNAYTRDATAFWEGPPRCKVWNSTGISLTTATMTLLTWDSESWDTDSMHSTTTNTSRLVATTAGLYTVTVAVDLPGTTAGTRALNVRKNAAGGSGAGTQVSYIFTAPANNTGSGQTQTFDVQMAANDYLEVFAYQSSGGTQLTTIGADTTFMSMRWVAAS